METIIVPVDGATNIKLEVLDYHSLQPLFFRVAATPVTGFEGLQYNATGEQFAWYESIIAQLPGEYRKVKVIASAARGASGGLIGRDNTLTEVPGRGLTLAYTQSYSDAVEDIFRDLAGSAEDFFLETGSIRDYPGSLTLLKRFVFEELERPEVLKRADSFATYGILLAGHFLGPDYLEAARRSGNEHSYWMCHTGARDINKAPGTVSSQGRRIESFQRLVQGSPSTVYRPLGPVSGKQAGALGISPQALVVPGGHDTCLSHIPIIATFNSTFLEKAGQPVIHLEAGSWTMVSLIGGDVGLPRDGHRQAVIVQGTVDGSPVVTSMYGGGRDFKYLSSLLEKYRIRAGGEFNEHLLEKVLDAADCFVLPNIDPQNHSTGPFPELKGRIINQNAFFQDRATALVLANLCVAITAAYQIDTVCQDRRPPVIVTGGGSKDPCFGRLLATLARRMVYALYDRQGNQLSETTTLGAAIAGKAACLDVHPYEVDIGGLGLTCRELDPFRAGIDGKLDDYRERYMKELARAEQARAE